MSDVMVGLDVHLKNTQVTVMKLNGEIVKKERVRTYRSELKRSLESVPKNSKVALESAGFCWPWIPKGVSSFERSALKTLVEIELRDAM